MCESCFVRVIVNDVLLLGLPCQLPLALSEVRARTREGDLCPLVSFYVVVRPLPPSLPFILPPLLRVSCPFLSVPYQPTPPPSL